ncbi:acyl carrier protein [Micromonospora sp. KC207]|uniref:acyl carrier protein n=1 Tax=Micromonospora sp. KC207 TaxID=2530377 RepID=UPI0010429F6D|nr:acyl carrier protein [Micromonospora sp. KC207]TDC60099.1 acyl carrier protein [Micromonospora sp. KC207]
MTLSQFLDLVRDEVGVVADADTSFDQLPDWDSQHLVWLVMAMERELGRPVPLPDALAAGSLGELYAVAAGD